MFIVINVIDTNLSLSTSLRSSSTARLEIFSSRIFLTVSLFATLLCPSCAKISSNCLIESGGAGPKVNNCITFISAVLQSSLDCWHCPDMKSSLACFTMTTWGPGAADTQSPGWGEDTRLNYQRMRQHITLHYRHITHYNHLCPENCSLDYLETLGRVYLHVARSQSISDGGSGGG